MAKTSPALFGARFCHKCGTRQRSLNHVCQPNAIDRWERTLAWNKRSAAAGQPAKKK